jgi:hypothetical protein
MAIGNKDVDQGQRLSNDPLMHAGSGREDREVVSPD